MRKIIERQRLITIDKGKLEIKQNDLKLEQRIRKLKEDYLKIRQEHENVKVTFKLQCYQILKEIYDLRKSQNPNYKLSYLCDEKDINVKPAEIYYLFNYELLTPFAREKIADNSITEFGILTALKRCVRLRNPELQNKFIKLMIDKDIQGTQLRNMNSIDIYNLLEMKKKRINIEKDILSINWRMRELYNLIKRNRNNFRGMNLTKLNEFHNKFSKLIEEINKENDSKI